MIYFSWPSSFRSIEGQQETFLTHINPPNTPDGELENFETVKPENQANMVSINMGKRGSILECALEFKAESHWWERQFLNGIVPEMCWGFVASLGTKGMKQGWYLGAWRLGVWREHTTVEGDLWIALRGKVYDCTKFLKFHPGGVGSLLKVAGKDGTQAFDKFHSWVDLRQASGSFRLLIPFHTLVPICLFHIFEVFWPPPPPPSPIVASFQTIGGRVITNWISEVVFGQNTSLKSKQPGLATAAVVVFRFFFSDSDCKPSWQKLMFQGGIWGRGLPPFFRRKRTPSAAM